MSRWPWVPKPAPAAHAVLVDHAQRPELDVLGIEVIGEREGVIGLQPAVVGVAAFVAASDLVHGYLH